MLVMAPIPPLMSISLNLNPSFQTTTVRQQTLLPHYHLLHLPTIPLVINPPLEEATTKAIVRTVRLRIMIAKMMVVAMGMGTTAEIGVTKSIGHHMQQNGFEK